MINIDVNEYLNDVFQKWEQGDIDGLDCYLISKKLDAISKAIKDHEDIKAECIEQIERYGKGEECSRGGATFKTSVRRSYKCSFPYLDAFKAKIKGLEAQSKALLDSGIPSAFVPDENGEQQEIMAADVSYSEVISVSLPKI